MIKKVTDTVTNCQLGFRRDMVHQLHLYSVTSIIDEKQRTEFTTFAFPDCKDTNDEVNQNFLWVICNFKGILTPYTFSLTLKEYHIRKV